MMCRCELCIAKRRFNFLAESTEYPSETDFFSVLRSSSDKGRVTWLGDFELNNFCYLKT